MGYLSTVQQKNIAWLLPRPKPDHYKGGMPLYCEEWLLELGLDILCMRDENVTILNLFCGMNQYGVRVDLNPKVKPHYLLDAHKCSRKLLRQEGKFNLILVDPPYSQKECETLYGILIKLNYKIWTKECVKLLHKNGLLIIYHRHIVPNPDPEKLSVVKRVFIGTRTMHTPRIAIFFKKG